MRLKICSKENIEIYAVDRKLLSGKRKKSFFFSPREILKQRKQTEALGKSILYTIRQQGRKGKELGREGEEREGKRQRVQQAVSGMLCSAA